MQPAAEKWKRRLFYGVLGILCIALLVDLAAGTEYFWLVMGGGFLFVLVFGLPAALIIEGRRFFKEPSLRGAVDCIVLLLSCPTAVAIFAAKTKNEALSGPLQSVFFTLVGVSLCSRLLRESAKNKESPEAAAEQPEPRFAPNTSVRPLVLVLGAVLLFFAFTVILGPR